MTFNPINANQAQLMQHLNPNAEQSQAHLQPQGKGLALGRQHHGDMPTDNDLLDPRSSSSGLEDNPFAGAEQTQTAELADETSYSMRYSRVMYEINIQTLSAISGPNGMAVEERSFSFSASYEFLQIASGDQELPGLQEMDSSSLIEQMADIFSPEKTAGRILDFALAQYAPQGDDTTGKRQDFSDYIGGLIQKGFDQAQAILGKIDDSIQNGISKTHDMVFGGLEDFVENGLPEDHAERSSAIREYAAQWQASVQMSYSRTSAAATYGPRGQLQETANPDKALEAQA